MIAVDHLVASQLLPNFAVRLSNINLPKLSLPEGKLEIIVFDEALAGFGVRIRAGGKRTWVAQYRLGTKQRRISIGSLDKIDADEARRRAKSIFAKVQLGQDPSVEKIEAVAQASITLGATAEQYLNKHASKRLKPKGLTETTLYLKRHWGPLRELPLQTVRLQHVASRLHDLARDNGPYAANRARAALSALYTWAIGEGLADINPVVGSNKPAVETKRDRVLSDVELTQIWHCAGAGDFRGHRQVAHTHRTASGRGRRRRVVRGRRGRRPLDGPWKPHQK